MKVKVLTSEALNFIASCGGVQDAIEYLTGAQINYSVESYGKFKVGDRVKIKKMDEYFTISAIILNVCEPDDIFVSDCVIEFEEGGWDSYDNLEPKPLRFVVISSLLEGTHFFSTDHCQKLPHSFVPVTYTLPMQVAPRKGLEDGMVDTLEKLVAVFYDDSKEIPNPNPKYKPK